MRKEISLLLLGCILSSCSTMPALFEEDELPRRSYSQNAQKRGSFGNWYQADYANEQTAPQAPSATEILARNPLPQIAAAANLGYNPQISFDTPDKNEPRLPYGCSIKERFDRTALAAYNFSDQKSRLSLHMKGDALAADVSEMMVRFRYKFQPLKDKKERCLYPAGFQGWGGSVYNEFIVREKDTIGQELMDKNPLGLFD